MFYFVNISTAAKMFHSKNIDELMETSADADTTMQLPIMGRAAAKESVAKISPSIVKPHKRATKTGARRRTVKHSRKALESGKDLAAAR